jgi:hypothetical protein
VDGATNGTIIRNNLIEDSGSGQQQTGIRIGQQAGEVALENNTVKAAHKMVDERR